MKKFKYRVDKTKNVLRGSSIMEVLIALAITTFCSALAVVIYLNVQKSARPFLRLKAVELAGYYMNKALLEKSFAEETVLTDGFTVKKFVSTSENYPDCLVLRTVVFDATKKKLSELETLVYKRQTAY